MISVLCRFVMLLIQGAVVSHVRSNKIAADLGLPLDSEKRIIYGSPDRNRRKSITR